MTLGSGGSGGSGEKPWVFGGAVSGRPVDSRRCCRLRRRIDSGGRGRQQRRGSAAGAARGGGGAGAARRGRGPGCGDHQPPLASLLLSPAEATAQVRRLT